MSAFRQLGRPALVVLAIVLTSLTAAACGSGESVERVAAETGSDKPTVTPNPSAAVRESVLAAARVWHPPSTPVSEADLRHNARGPGRFDDSEDVACRFTLKDAGGTTPKFYCELPTGGAVKIKYGNNPELHAEVAASRLLSALGFGADRVFVVRRVRCAGCPTFPYQALRCFARTGLASTCFPGGIDYNRILDFEMAVVERKLEGRVIETTDDEGWAWFELDRIDPARGGSSRAEVDALRLMAVLLAHWDNKSANQRLICPPGNDRADGSCAQPLAIMQDLGATFGPTKIDLYNWRQGRIWKDGATCTVSMEHLPWGGGTFPEKRISEGGRVLLLGLLDQLSDRQLRDLFEGSRVTAHDQVSAEARHAGAWVDAFKAKVKQIRDGGPCPS